MAVGIRKPQGVSKSLRFLLLWDFHLYGTYYVYIIYSESGDCYCKGFSENPEARLLQHNNQKSRYTSKYRDWKLIYIESFETKRDALIREKGLKKYSKTQISEVIKLSKNILRSVD